MINFPDAPTLNQIFTGPRGQFIWDGVKWKPYSGGTDAPTDGSVYGRLNAAWAKAVPLAGGVMTGLLTLSGDPSAALGAVTKQYSDTKVPLAGGTMTGLLTLSADPTANLGAVTKQYSDTKLAKAGGTMTGTLTLAGSPSGALDAATKGYVDGLVTTYAAPTALLGLTVVPGSAATAMRSDAAPRLDQSIAPTWTGIHKFTNTTASTSPTTGALTVTGSIGVSGGVTLANNTNLWAMDSAGTQRTMLYWDNANPDVVHLRNNQAAAGGAIQIESRSGGAVTATFTASGVCDLYAARINNQASATSGAGLELMWNGTNSVIQSYDRSAGAFKGLLLQGLSISTNVGMTIAGLTDVAGTIRSKAQTNPSSGAGLEVIYNGTAGYLQCLDWAGPTYKTINIQGANYVFTVVTGGNGNVAIQSSAASGAYNNGALTVAGGVGIGGALYTNANANFNGNLAANGTVYAAGYANYAGTVNFASVTANINTSYNQLYDSSNRVAIILGGTADSQSYYRNTQHNFQNAGGGTAYTYITATGTAIYPTTASSGTTSGALTVGGGAGIAGDLYAKTINGRNAGNWAGTFINSTVAVNQAGIYVACGAAPAANDTQSIFALWTDPNISAYIGYVIRNGANSLQYANASDARLKTTVREHSVRGLDVLREIAVRDFYWNNDEDRIEVQGLYAQEVLDYYPEAVARPEMKDKDGNPTGEIAWGIDYGRLTPMLIRAIQQLADKVDSLTAELEALRAA